MNSALLSYTRPSPRVRLPNRLPVSRLAVVLLALAFPAGTSLATDYGDISLDTRLRFETAQIDGLEDADALTLRLRLGYTTPVYKGFQAMVEGEFTGVGDEDSYNAAGVRGDPAKAVIADPENAQLDQGYLGYEYKKTTAKVGRQRMVLDNQRFIGDVAWRQNRQTFDAASVKSTTIDNLSLFYAYVDNVVRIFGSEAPSTGSNAREAGSNSHLVNASYKAHEAAKITGYAYLLDLDDIPPTSSADSYGIHVQGSVPAGDDANLGYYAEYAYQQDSDNNPLDYQADYYHLRVDGDYKGAMGNVGYEVLGSDNTGAANEEGAPVFASFQTPLATLHKFNGFADRFLVTPPKGLQDAYAMLGYKLVPAKGGPWILKVWYHDFTSDEGSDDLGDEWDALLVKPFELESIPGKFKALAKYANYRAGDSGADTERMTVELNYGVTF